MTKKLTSAERNTQREIERAMEYKTHHAKRAALKELTIEAASTDRVSYALYSAVCAALRLKTDAQRQLGWLKNRADKQLLFLAAGRFYSGVAIQNVDELNVVVGQLYKLAALVGELAYEAGYYVPALTEVSALTQIEWQRRTTLVHDGAADCWRIAETAEPGAFPTPADYIGAREDGSSVARRRQPENDESWQPYAYAEEWLAWRALRKYVEGK